MRDRARRAREDEHSFGYITKTSFATSYVRPNSFLFSELIRRASIEGAFTNERANSCSTFVIAPLLPRRRLRLRSPRSGSLRRTPVTVTAAIAATRQLPP